MNKSAQNWPWPDSLDALVAAPRHHKLLFENERVRVLEVRIPPGDLVPGEPDRPRHFPVGVALGGQLPDASPVLAEGRAHGAAAGRARHDSGASGERVELNRER